MKPLTVVVYTHCRTAARASYAERTIVGLANVLYEGEKRIWIADDNSDPNHRVTIGEAVNSLIAYSSFRSAGTSIAGGRGYGGSYNAATQALHDEDQFFLCIEDDWELRRSFDFTPYAQAIEERPDILGCIRFGYLGHTAPLAGTVEYVNHRNFLLFDPDSPERHVFAGHPRLESRDWQRKVGPWPERLDAGTTEFEVAGRREARTGVAWPIGIEPGSLFAHIGTIQAREDQS